jgi:hypothetical protein
MVRPPCQKGEVGMNIDHDDSALLSALMEQPVKTGAFDPPDAGRLSRMVEAGLVRQVAAGAGGFFVLTGAGVSAFRPASLRRRRPRRR